MNYQIRKAILQDIPAIIKLCAEHAIYEKAAYNKSGKAEGLKEALFGKDPVLFCYVVVKDQTHIGYATYTKEYSTWQANYYIHMDCLFLTYSARGLGIGEALVATIAEAANEMDCEVQWQTPAFNVRALKFYKRIGATAKCKTRLYLDKDSIQKLLM